MPKTDRLKGSIGRIDLDFVEREATPKMFMKIAIQVHLAGLSLSNTVSLLEVFGVHRARSTVHNWVHKADLQPKPSKNPDQVAVDETVIRLNDERYWLYTAVDTDTNELLLTKLEPTRNKVIASSFFRELREKHDVDDADFLIDGDHALHYACQRHGLSFRYERHGDRNSVERVIREIKRRTSSFSNCFSNAKQETADQWLAALAFAWNQLI